MANKLRIVPRDPHRLVDEPDFQMMFEGFACNVPKGSPATPDILTPDIFVRRAFEQFDLLMPDGNIVEFWGFVDPLGPNAFLGAFPSDMIRIIEGQLFHGRLEGLQKGTHTIHWHGMEPTPMNDGVGKLSFEVNGQYTYQWYASAAGTYFYHCHHNTVLHFELGMYGMLIIDPPKPNGAPGPNPPYPTGGPGFIRRTNDIIPYDKEAIWVTDDVDPMWHMQGHDAGFCEVGQSFGPDVGLNNFNPEYFLITGVPSPWCANLPTDPTHPGVAVTVGVGQTLLVRLLCAGYTVHRYTISDLDAEVIAMDGRVMGDSSFNQYSQPFILPANQPFELTAARRFDLIISPTAGDIGSHRVLVDVFDADKKGKLLGTMETFIHVV